MSNASGSSHRCCFLGVSGISFGLARYRLGFTKYGDTYFVETAELQSREVWRAQGDDEQEQLTLLPRHVSCCYCYPHLCALADSSLSTLENNSTATFNSLPEFLGSKLGHFLGYIASSVCFFRPIHSGSDSSRATYHSIRTMLSMFCPWQTYLGCPRGLMICCVFSGARIMHRGTIPGISLEMIRQFKVH